MLETVSSNKVKPFYLLLLGSSSTDGEDKDLSNLRLTTGMVYPGGIWSSYDVASHSEPSALISDNETYKNKEIFTDEMIEHDIYVKMPPKRRRTVQFKIQHIRKAKPRIVIPENYYSDI